MNPVLKVPAALMAMALGALLVCVLWMADPVSAESASAPKPINCQSMSSGASTPLMVGGCSRKGITGGDGTLTNCAIGTCIAWQTGKQIDFTSSHSVPTTSRCPSNLTEVDTVGRVISASGTSTKRLIGTAVTYDACVTNQINVVTVELVPGTLFTIA